LFELTVSPKARKGLKKIPDYSKRDIAELLLVMQENPVPAEQYDVTKLKGRRDTFRVRKGDFRIIYTVNWNEREIRILLIKPRETAYK
jgi:mRNA interferase RelE/StbE